MTPIRIQNSSAGDVDYRSKHFSICIPGHSIGEDTVKTRIPDACLSNFLREMRRFPFIKVEDVLEESTNAPAPTHEPDVPEFETKPVEPEQAEDIGQPSPDPKPPARPPMFKPLTPEETQVSRWLTKEPPPPDRDDFSMSAKAQKVGESTWKVFLPDGREFEVSAGHHKQAKANVYEQLYGGKTA